MIINIMKKYFVYLLESTNHSTYVGATVNLNNRLRQHNGEIKGGAKYTHSFKGDGMWVYYLKIKNLNKSEALSIERTAKNKRKKAIGKNPIDKRLNVLLPILEQYPYSVIEYFN